AAAAERRVERIAPRADDRRQRQGEEALGPDDEADQRAGRRERVQEWRQRHRDGRDREGEPEGAEPERPEQPPLNRRQRGQLVRNRLGRHQAGAAALSGARPPATISTTANSARVTSSSRSGSCPKAQPVRISSSAPYQIVAVRRASRSFRNSPVSWPCSTIRWSAW